MIGRQDKVLIDQVSDAPSIFFFIISCKILCKNCFKLFSYKYTKIKIKSFESIIYKNLHIKKLMLGTSEFRGLVNKTFVPATHRTSVSVFFVHQFLTWETIWEKLENCFLTKSLPKLFDINVLACLYHFAIGRIFLR